jgi:hypothetical protein
VGCSGVALEKAAIDADLFTAVQTELLAQQHEVLVARLQRCAVVLAEIGDGFVARVQTLDQPHHFQVAYCLAFQTPAGMEPIEVAVKIQFQQCARREGRLPRLTAGTGVLEAESLQVQRLDVGVNGPDRVAFGHVFVKARRQEHQLVAALAGFVAACHRFFLSKG